MEVILIRSPQLFVYKMDLLLRPSQKSCKKTGKFLNCRYAPFSLSAELS